MKNPAAAAGFCFFLLFFVSLAGCTGAGTGTGSTGAGPAQTVIPAAEPVSEAPGPVSAAPAARDTQAEAAGLRANEPVSITVNSAQKVLGLGTQGKVYKGADSGEVFLVLDITVRNNAVKDGLTLSNRSFVVRDIDRNAGTGRLLTSHSAYRNALENLLVDPVTIRQGESVTRQLLYQVNDSAEYRLVLRGPDKTPLSVRPVSFSGLLTVTDPVDITIDSVDKVRNYPTTKPMAGHSFLILNDTVKNTGAADGFSFSWTSTDLHDLRGGDYAEHSLNNGANLVQNLANPISPGTMIRLGDSISGQVIFGIADSDEYRLNLIDANRTIIASRLVHAL